MCRLPLDLVAHFPSFSFVATSSVVARPVLPIFDGLDMLTICAHAYSSEFVHCLNVPRQVESHKFEYRPKHWLRQPLFRIQTKSTQHRESETSHNGASCISLCVKHETVVRSASQILCREIVRPNALFNLLITMPWHSFSFLSPHSSINLRNYPTSYDHHPQFQVSRCRQSVDGCQARALPRRTSLRLTTL